MVIAGLKPIMVADPKTMSKAFTKDAYAFRGNKTGRPNRGHSPTQTVRLNAFRIRGIAELLEGHTESSGN